MLNVDPNGLFVCPDFCCGLSAVFPLSFVPVHAALPQHLAFLLFCSLSPGPKNMIVDAQIRDTLKCHESGQKIRLSKNVENTCFL